MEHLHALIVVQLIITGSYHQHQDINVNLVKKVIVSLLIQYLQIEKCLLNNIY